jgi:hypothetical protein
MTNVQFDRGGQPLVAKAVFKGKFFANYEMLLREANTNLNMTLIDGDNANSEDDAALLPKPIAINDGRRVILETGFFGDDTNAKRYEIRLEIFQGTSKIGEDKDEGDLTGKGQFSLLFIKLVAI